MAHIDATVPAWKRYELRCRFSVIERLELPSGELFQRRLGWIADVLVAEGG